MRYWILQSNPRKYRIFDYLRENPSLSDTWQVSLFKDEIKPGDHAFIWVSNEAGKRNRGIYAKAEVVAPPDEDRQPYERELPYWIDEDERGRLSKLPRLELRYIKVLLDNPLLEDDLRKAHGLGNLLVLRMARRGVYKLSEDEGRITESLID
ncbi:MAG: EVE domain-containing protein [Dehalococcoidales bacterium]|nr:EVE domain-containing protein [Dehalococcoidales bacterium]